MLWAIRCQYGAKARHCEFDQWVECESWSKDDQGGDEAKGFLPGISESQEMLVDFEKAEE